MTRCAQILSLCVLLTLSGMSGAFGQAVVERGSCPEIGEWLDPATGGEIEPEQLKASLARRPVVLLGEEHDNADHHRWQLQMLAALHAYRSDMIIGFEMFPRRVQNVLDQWSAGKLSVAEFLKQSDWERVWGFDPELYLPLFHFARQNRIPMIALNLDRSVVRRIGHEGWDKLSPDERGGISRPADVSGAYLKSLADVWRQHRERGIGGEKPEKTLSMEEVLKDEAFKRFVATQQVWDRAMAESLAAARKKNPDALIVGVMGQGHIEYGHGVPHQLRDLGIGDAASLIPFEAGPDCAELPKGIADAAFIVAPRDRRKSAPARPRLGVLIENADKGVKITRVVAGSVAEASTLEAGDVVVSAAGRKVEKISDLIEIVLRQAPGTWLPLRILRGDSELEVVARFPVKFGESN
jgi:uncharacterized iron-regulated protein